MPSGSFLVSNLKDFLQSGLKIHFGLELARLKCDRNFKVGFYSAERALFCEDRIAECILILSWPAGKNELRKCLVES